MDLGTDDLNDAAATLSALEAAVDIRQDAEVRQLELACHWADQHSADPKRDADGRRTWSENRLIRIGGPGTPRIQEFSIADFAISLRVHTGSATATIAAALDLRHRLPKLWARVVARQVTVWVAIKIAAMTRHLSAAAAAYVDDALAPYVAGESPGRLLELAAAKIIEADPDLDKERRDAERRRKHVSLTRTDENGLRTLIARLEAGDAVFLDAEIDLVADLLIARGDSDPKDAVRAKALGWLARPFDVVQLLLEAQQDNQPDGPTSTALDLLARADLSKARPRVNLFIHLSEAALTGASDTVARVEGIGPIPTHQVRDWLGHTAVRSTQVIDLHQTMTASGYHHPERLKHHVLLTTPGDVFPHATTVSRNIDLDHTRAFDPHGPPGQTSSTNTSPLGRYHHRLKTHAGWTVQTLDPGEYLWRSPHGRYRLVDHTGTRTLTEPEARGLISKSLAERFLIRYFLAA